MVQSVYEVSTLIVQDVYEVSTLTAVTLVF